jgi:predicted AAA+ superfamily ATPase
MQLIDRPEYLEQLKLWQKHDDLVKIVTGVRRCGKSKLFELFQNYLKITGVVENQIISINLEDDVQTKAIGLALNTKTKLLEPYDALLDFIMNKIAKDKKTYVFIDEVQLLDNWQRVANTLRLQNVVDVYLTGSNAYMFSSDLANVFGGRYIEIKMQPLSFNEYLSGLKIKGIDVSALADAYKKYTVESGFPQTIYLSPNTNMIKDYLLDSVYNNTIQKDIVQRFGISNPIRLQEVIKFLFDNISNPTSLLGIQRALKANNIDISPTTLNNYVKGLLDSYLMHKCLPYDVKGKRILESDAKYYACDIGLRSAILGASDADVGRALENIIYLELLHRGYQVSTGKVGTKTIGLGINKEVKKIEVDFVAQKSGGIVEYFQVAWTVLSDDGKLLRRELSPLEEIKDSYPKYLITMDAGSAINNGIKRINAMEWLSRKE